MNKPIAVSSPITRAGQFLLSLHVGKYYLRPTKIAILGLGTGIKEQERDREFIGSEDGWRKEIEIELY